MTTTHYSHDLTGPAGHARSPLWPAVERRHKLREPLCRGCGHPDRGAADGRPNDVHHVRPFHVHPELELVDANLATVCRECHFLLCHAGNWSHWVTNCVEVLGAHLARLSGRPARDVVPVVAA